VDLIVPWWLLLLLIAGYFALVILVTVYPQGAHHRMNLATYAKAIAAIVAGAVTQAIASAGLDTSQTVESAIAVLVTALAVFLVPNKKTPEA
jgi:phosphatidylglycerophosphate synthase